MALGQFIQGGLRRAYRSPVIWFWAFNGLRVASGLLVLPLLWRELSKPDLGMYFIFLRITALLPIIDFGLSATVTRFVGYAMAGATELRAHGVAPAASGLPPNKTLLWDLLFTYRFLYRALSLIAMLILGAWGTWNVGINVQSTASPTLTWWAWGVALFAAVFEMYAGWWNVYLRGMNEVLLSARMAVSGYIVQIVLGSVLLIYGAGLLSMPVATLVGSLLERSLSRASCLRLLAPAPETVQPHKLSLTRILWPNTWRIGLQFLSVYLGTSVPALIFAATYGASVFSQYGLTVQIVGFCTTMAAVWTVVRWPLVTQYQSQENYAESRRILGKAARLQTITFCMLAAGAVFCVPWLLRHVAPDKHVVEVKWFVLLAVGAFFEMRFSFWTTLLTTQNRVPFVWPTVTTNLVVLTTIVGLWAIGDLTLPALILVPLCGGAVFNYWYWAIEGAKTLRTSWIKFAFGFSS